MAGRAAATAAPIPVVAFRVPRHSATATATSAPAAPVSLLDSKLSAHDATMEILVAYGVPLVAHPNSRETWGLAQRKAIFKMWQAHVKANPGI